MAAIYRNGIQYSAGATATFDAVPAEGSPNPITSGAIFEYMSSFQDKLTFDESPTANSTNPVTSEGIKAAIDAKKGSVEGYYYDNKFYVESTHETEITGQTEQIYVDLATNNTYRYGGSDIGFVELSAALEFDSTPTAGSSNPVTSDGIKTALDAKQDTLTFDSTPTANSTNPVASEGIKTALDTKQNTLTFDNTPTANSTNPVTSAGIKTALDVKQSSVSGYLYNGKFYKENSHTTEIAGEEGVVYVDIATNEFYRYLTPTTITLGQKYSFGGFTWIAAEQLATGIYVMQSTGMTGGYWPGYKLTQDFDGTTSFGSEYTGYVNDIDYLNIANYDTITKNWYSTYSAVEASGGRSSDGTYSTSTAKDGLSLVPNAKAGTTSHYTEGSGHYWTALKTAAGNSRAFGAIYSSAWLGSVNSSDTKEAWGVSSYGTVSGDKSQNYEYVVAPAFNLDLSKVHLSGNTIELGGRTTPTGFIQLSGTPESSIKSLIESYITYGTSEMTAGESALADGHLYFQYE